MDPEDKTAVKLMMATLDAYGRARTKGAKTVRPALPPVRFGQTHFGSFVVTRPYVRPNRNIAAILGRINSAYNLHRNKILVRLESLEDLNIDFIMRPHAA